MLVDPALDRDRQGRLAHRRDLARVVVSLDLDDRQADPGQILPYQRELMDHRLDQTVGQHRVDLAEPALARGLVGSAAEEAIQAHQDERLLDGEQHPSPERLHLEDHPQGAAGQLGLRSGPGRLGGVDRLELDRGAKLGRQPRGRGLAESLDCALDPALMV
jgi:hypothetical protein